MGYFSLLLNRLAWLSIFLIISTVIVAVINSDPFISELPRQPDFYYYSRLTPENRVFWNEKILGPFNLNLSNNTRRLAIASFEKNFERTYLVSDTALSENAYKVGRFYWLPLKPRDQLNIFQTKRLSQPSLTKPRLWWYKPDYGYVSAEFLADYLKSGEIKQSLYFIKDPQRLKFTAVPINWNWRQAIKIWRIYDWPKLKLRISRDAETAVLAQRLHRNLEVSPGLKKWLDTAWFTYQDYGDNQWGLEIASRENALDAEIQNNLENISAQLFPTINTRFLPDNTVVEEFKIDAPRSEEVFADYKFTVEKKSIKAGTYIDNTGILWLDFISSCISHSKSKIRNIYYSRDNKLLTAEFSQKLVICVDK